MRVYVTGGSGYLGHNLILYLGAEGIASVALARSEASKAKVEAVGATAVMGDLLDDPADLAKGMAGCDVVAHCAAYVDISGPIDEMRRANVGGTENMIAAARKAGVPRFVHISTESVLINGEPLLRADESWPYPANPLGPYATTKQEAERVVVAANGDGLTTVVVRPRLIWGKDDSVVLPGLVAATKSGDLAWFGGGMHLTSTVHVDNVCEGILAAARKGAGGEIYFLKDAEDRPFREFVSTMLEAVGVKPPTRTMPMFFAWTAARVYEWWASVSGNKPLLTRAAAATLLIECTVDDAKARRDLGYTSHISFEEGIADLRRRHEK